MNKLLFLVNVDWFFLSHRLPIALAAARQGYEVHIATRITNKLDILKSHGFIVHPLEIGRSDTGFVGELVTFAKILSIYRQVNPNLVHLVTIKPVLYGGIVARLMKVPCVVSAISGLGFLFVARTGLRRQLFRHLALLLYRLAMGHGNQKVIFQNRSDRKTLLNACKIQKDKTCLIRGSGVNLAKYPVTPEPEGTPVVVMASRMLKDKGVLEFVEAARQLRLQGIEARFQLVGAPDLDNPESVTKEDIAGWSREGVIEYLGFESDIADLFSRSHIVVLPSYREGLPKVLIEAAAAGRAVITTDEPGCRDAIEPNLSGLLVPSHDAGALAFAIKQLINNKTLRRQMRLAGRKLAEREFGIEKVITAHLTIYSQLMENAES